MTHFALDPAMTPEDWAAARRLAAPAVTKTGGVWDPADRPVYFLAGNTQYITPAAPIHPYVLVAVNELGKGDQTMRTRLERLLDTGAHVLLDSGIWWMAQRHTRLHHPGSRTAVYSVLALPPEQVDGWRWLWDRYRQIIDEYGDRLWGYIELDQGGRDRKRDTRTRLEQQGYRPIPVYHPLSDGIGYFHELAQRYDRIATANLVNTRGPQRVPMLHTLAHLRQQYPHLWVHLLGVTPDQYLYGTDAGDSGDSTVWYSGVRWKQGYREAAAGQNITGVRNGLRLPLGRRGVGESLAVRMYAFGQRGRQRNWRYHRARLAELGLLHPQETTQP